MFEFIQRILLEPDHFRLRMGWRLLTQILLLFFLALLFTIPLAIVSFFIDVPLAFQLVFITGLAVICSVLFARRLIDRRSIVSLGLKVNRLAFRDLGVGVLIAALQIALVFGIELAAGWLDFQGFAWQFSPPSQVIGNLLLWLVVFTAVGFYEELLSRGYHFQNLEEGLNTFWAILLSSLVFGVMHLTNPGATWVAALGIFLAGLFFSLAYLRTRQLWLPAGLHFGWNFFLGPVFGFPVSGMPSERLIVHQAVGPETFTGGQFGPEAGLIVLPALLFGAALVWWYSNKRSPKPPNSVP